MACTVKKVDALLTRLTAANVLEDTVVIIHGDHGSRNSHVTPAIATLGGFSDKEMIEHHSTLFAVRNPRYDRANYPGYIALDTILRELTMNDFNPAHVGQTGDDPWIVLRSRGELGDADKRYPYPDGPGQDATQQ